jgi:flagellar basal body rod protein FlgC
MQASSIAAAGITTAVQRFDASAARTAARPLDNLAEETVERLQAGTAVKANAAVLRTADEMTGALLDILA